MLYLYMKTINTNGFEIIVDDEVYQLIKNTKIIIQNRKTKYSLPYACISFDTKTKLPTPNFVRQKICIKCNKKSNRFVRGLCWNCYFKERYHNRHLSYKSKNNMNGNKKKIIYLHQYITKYIMKLDIKGKNTDHVNRNSLDNRKENLRVVTSQINQFNAKDRNKKRYSPDGKELPKNVYYYGFGYTSNPVTKHPYVVRFGWKRKNLNLGCFESLEKANKAILNFKLKNKDKFLFI